jgi:hypothetical protein
MPSFMSTHPPRRRILVISVVAPLMIVLAALAFAWPAARIAPRAVPVGIIGTAPSVQATSTAIDRSQPGAFGLRQYSTESEARRAIDDRTVYGALESTPAGVSVFEATAASPTVAQLLNTLAQAVATRSGGNVPGASSEIRVVDVVAISQDDPRGVVFSSVLLPISVCSVIAAMMISILIGLRPAWRQVLALTIVASIAGLGAYLVAQGFLGALPNDPVASWAALSLTVLSISAAVAGLVALIGPAGVAIGAALMVFVGNPFSGATSAPELLPGAVRDIGQWLPPGAGAELLRSTAYFGGHDAGQPLLVLALWSIAGLSAIFVGHHTLPRFFAHPDRINRRSPVAAGRHEQGPGRQPVSALLAVFASEQS